jgi:hypothetical protein
MSPSSWRVETSQPIDHLSRRSRLGLGRPWRGLSRRRGVANGQQAAQVLGFQGQVQLNLAGPDSILAFPLSQGQALQGQGIQKFYQYANVPQGFAQQGQSQPQFQLPGPMPTVPSSRSSPPQPFFGADVAASICGACSRGIVWYHHRPCRGIRAQESP